jgi:dATP/dGTP diphosphohydrolase
VISGGYDVTRQAPSPEFVTKDSGVREEYDSGMVRDTQEGKPRYNLIDRAFLKRWAALMTRGAEKYGVENWRNANSQEELDRFQESAHRHMMQWLDGETDEDHAVAVAFNLAAAEFVKARMAA